MGRSCFCCLAASDAGVAAFDTVLCRLESISISPSSWSSSSSVLDARLSPQAEVDDGRHILGVTSMTFSISAAEGDEAYSSCSGPSMSASLKPCCRSRRRRRLFSSRTLRAAAWISCEASAPTASHERYFASSSCRYSLRRARDRRWLSLPRSTQISLFLGPVTDDGVGYRMRARLAFCCGVGSLMLRVIGRQFALLVQSRKNGGWCEGASWS